MPRILHVISGLDPQNGGPTTALVGLAVAQRSVGLDVTILATWQIPDGLPVAENLRKQAVSVIHVGPATGKLSRHPELADKTAAAVSQADVVHIHGLFEEVQHLAARAAQKQKVPYIITPHGMLSPWNMSRSKWGKKLYMLWRLRRNLDRAAAIHYTSDVERDLVAPLKIKAPPLVQGLGLDLGEFQNLPECGRFRAAFPQIGDRRIVLFLGRIDYKKGLDILIPAFAAAKLAKTVLVIVGPNRDGYEPAVRKMVRDCGIDAQVVFTGMLKGRQRIEAYVDADLFTLTSYQENFGITVVEAMASGRPVLISDQVNIHPQITASGAGEVIPADMSRATGALQRWMANTPLRQEAGMRARDFAMNHYDWVAIAREWQSLYASTQRGDFLSASTRL